MPCSVIAGIVKTRVYVLRLANIYILTYTTYGISYIMEMYEQECMQHPCAKCLYYQGFPGSKFCKFHGYVTIRENIIIENASFPD